MARYAYKGTMRDGHGHVILSGTVSVYLAGTTTAASVYTASSGGTAVNSVTSSATDGTFEFYVDESDYGYGQLFKIVLSKGGYTACTFDNIEIIKLPWTTNAGTPKFFTHQDSSIADDDYVDLPDATSGILVVSCNAECGQWVVQATGVVAKVAGSTNTSDTDSDGSISVFDNGTNARVRNRLGTAGKILIFYIYN